MFKKLFGLGSKTNEETIVAPLTGAVKKIITNYLPEVSSLVLSHSLLL